MLSDVEIVNDGIMYFKDYFDYQQYCLLRKQQLLKKRGGDKIVPYIFKITDNHNFVNVALINNFLWFGVFDLNQRLGSVDIIKDDNLIKNKKLLKEWLASQIKYL